MSKLLTDSLFVAICRFNLLYSRKYGIVGYYPASSMFYLTAFILCQFQGKLTGTLPDFDAQATGVMLEPEYKYKPLVFVVGIEQFHNKPAPCQLASPSSRIVEFFERSHRSVDLRKYRQPCIMSCIMSSIMWWI
jgi:hypothetical protein